jgi:hypothetical protein
MTEPRRRFNELRRSAPIAYDDLEEFSPWPLLV